MSILTPVKHNIHKVIVLYIYIYLVLIFHSSVFEPQPIDRHYLLLPAHRLMLVCFHCHRSAGESASGVRRAAFIDYNNNNIVISKCIGVDVSGRGKLRDHTIFRAAAKLSKSSPPRNFRKTVLTEIGSDLFAATHEHEQQRAHQPRLRVTIVHR